MSWKSGKNGDRAKRTGWSGGPTSRDKPLHRWQDSTAAAEGLQTRRRRHRNRWVLASVLALGLLAFLIWLLLPNSKSQLIIFTATDYAMPIPLNSWADEDRKSLADLDGVNLLVTDGSEQWNKDSGTKIEFNRETIEQNQSRRSTPLIVYLSMHGVVDDDGQPCLLPPGASIRDRKTWKRVEDVLDEIKNAVPDTRDVLLILDCNRIRVNWNLGILYNSFSERVQQLVERTKPPRMAVLLAAGPGQVNWASSDVDGSVFGRYLQLGLAGAAADSSPFRGRDISLQELFFYLKSNVTAWSEFNRGEPQTPILIPADAHFHVAWGVKRGKLAALQSRLNERQPPPEAVQLEDIKKLWQNLEELRKHDLIRFDPISCRNFEHELLRLEELSEGGEGYADRAKLEFNSLQKRLSEAVEKAHTADLDSRALVDRLETTRDAAWARIPQAAHTLPTSEYFGACDEAQSKQIEIYWKNLIGSSEAKVQKPDKESSAPQPTPQLAETQFLDAIRQQQVSKLWKTLELPKVIELRMRAEQLAVPGGTDKKLGDERAHYYARFAAESADENRRRAEDLLFVGEQKEVLDQYDDYATKAKNQYDWTEQVMNDSAKAFDVVDQASAEIPYLASWLCSPLSAELAERDVLVRERLNPLIKNLAALSEEINQFKKPEERDRLPFRGRAEDKVLPEFNSDDGLKGRFKKEVERLTKGDAQGHAGWRAIEALLSTPLIPVDSRMDLLANRDEIARKLNDDFFAKKKEKKEELEKPESVESVSYLSIMESWHDHPLLETLRPDNAGVRKEDVLGWCEEAAADVRARLQLRVVLGTNQSATPPSQDNEILHERQGLSRAERALRVVAPIGYGFTDSTSDPIAELRRFDLQQLLIWHAQRAINDFWGVAAARGVEVPFFQLAATDYLQAATVVRSETSTAIGDQIDGLNKLLAKRLRAKSEPMQIEAKSELAFDSEKPIEVALAVGLNPKANDYPPGFTAVFLRDPRDSSGRLTNAQFDHSSFVELSKAAERQSFKASISGTSNSPNLDAVTFFRGREYASRFSLRAIEGVLIEYKPYQYNKQTITLRGDLRQRSSYVFIVDCSGSMENPTDIDTEGKKIEDIRMNLAKKHFKTLLDELAIRNLRGEGIHVGVLFYGHRVKREQQKLWESKAPMTRQFSPALILPQGLSYSQDVELIQSLGRFEPKEATEVERRLAIVKPFGETPLFKSLIEALKLFGSDDTRKGIIAITDGMNHQSEPDTSQQAVLDEIRKYSPQIPIHILGFDLAPQEAQYARDQYQRIADETNGSYREVNSGAELLRQLRKHLEGDTYTVREVNHPPARLNKPISISGSQLPKAYTVDYRAIRNKQVTLQGGEAIQLLVAQDGSAQDIVAIPYDQSVVEEADLIAGAGGAPTDLHLRVHFPRRDTTSVTFPISLQRLPTNRRHFTPRPAETWLEVTPLTDNRGQADSYAFYDVNFKPEEPVPVLEWTAGGWDKWPDARRARIKFWCKYQATPPTGSKPLSDLLNSPANVGGAQLSAKAGIKNGRYHVQIIEGKHPPSVPIDAFRIQFETDPRAVLRWVVHQFDSENRVARHSYYFDPGQAERVLTSNLSRILVTDAKAVKYGALQLAGEGLEVPIGKAGHLFSPRAAASGQ